MVDPGNLVKADDTVLTSLVSLDPMHAYFDVDERTVLRVRRMIQEKQIDSARSTDLRVQIGLADDRDRYPLEGVVDFIDNQIDPGTGTLRVRAKVENPLGKDGRTRLLSPGLFVRVRLPIGKKAPTLVVPEKALGSDQGGRFVYVVTDIQRVTRKMKTTGKDGHEEVAEVEVEQGTAEYRKVQVGPPAEGGGEEGSSLRVIRDLPGVPPEKALTARSRIIVEGQQRVRRGQPVLLMPARKAGADR
jgi:RND family efflux transporter MFP subunit